MKKFEGSERVTICKNITNTVYTRCKAKCNPKDCVNTPLGKERRVFPKIVFSKHFLRVIRAVCTLKPRRTKRGRANFCLKLCRGVPSFPQPLRQKSAVLSTVVFYFVYPSHQQPPPPHRPFTVPKTNTKPNPLTICGGISYYAVMRLRELE